MPDWLMVIVVIVALLAIFAAGKRAVERQNRPFTRDEIDHDRQRGA